MPLLESNNISVFRNCHGTPSVARPTFSSMDSVHKADERQRLRVRNVLSNCGVYATSKRIGPIFVLVVLLGSLSQTAFADLDGAFCTTSGYLAYELKVWSGSPHVLHVLSFEPVHGTYQVGELEMNDFQVNRLTCTPDRIEISGWGWGSQGWRTGFEQYIVAVPALTADTSLVARKGLQIIEHHSDPSPPFDHPSTALDPDKDASNPRWLWRLPLGSHLLEPTAEGDRRYFLVIGEVEETEDPSFTWRIQTVTVVEKDASGTILHEFHAVDEYRKRPVDCLAPPFIRGDRCQDSF